MVKFFRKKEEYSAILEKKKPSYWEEFSHMQAILNSEEDFNLDESIFERISKIPNLILKEYSLPIKEKETGFFNFEYKGINYKAGFYCSDFNIQNMFQFQKQYFTEKEMKKFQNATKTLILFLEFNKKELAQASYKMQLELIDAMIPNHIGIFDESAEKILNSKWVKLAVNSKVLPLAKDLYSVQAVLGDNDEIWLHTHGLLRFGCTELEILSSSREYYDVHYNTISAFAGKLIEGDVISQEKDYSVLGQSMDASPIVATYRIWTEGLKEYKSDVLGGLQERRDSHNSETSIIFFYTSEENCNNKKIGKISELNKQLANNPIFYFSSQESIRMAELARERFLFLEKAVKKFKSNEEKFLILLKLGLPTISGQSADDLEHIWFELLDLQDNNNFKARLTQESYDIADIHKGDEGIYNLNQITDWVIYTEKSQIVPGTVYLLEE